MKLTFNIIFIFYIKYNDLLSNLLLNSSYCPSEKDYFHLIFSLLNIIAGSRGMVSVGATSAKSFVQTVKQNYKMYFINWIAHGGGQKGVNTRLQFCSCSVWHCRFFLAVDETAASADRNCFRNFFSREKGSDPISTILELHTDKMTQDTLLLGMELFAGIVILYRYGRTKTLLLYIFYCLSSPYLTKVKRIKHFSVFSHSRPASRVLVDY